jgi:glycosyltransferase involved in cell wall biosynthesis
MKIAILTSGILPVPAAQGGAVENLIDFYLEYNNRHQLHDITVYSVWNSKVKNHPALKSQTNHYYYIDNDSWVAKLRKRLYLRRAGGKEMHHYSIEYFFEQAFKHICQCNYDIIILENRPAYSLKLTGKTKAKLLYHLHNEKLDNQSSQGTLIYHSADRIICVSDYITSCVRTINPNDRKCITVHNGIDLKTFSPNSISACKTDIGMNDNDFILIFSGRVNKEKGILELIQAMCQLEGYPNIKLLVIGSSFYGNTNKEDNFIRSLKEQAAKIQDRILFTGFIPYNKIPKYLKISDLAVIPSNWDDPFPTTVLEAQAMGLPIITTRRGGIPEEVTEENAILLNTDEHFVDNLADAILDLYHHPEKRKKMAETSLERSKLFDKETYARNFFKALEDGLQ